MALSIEHFLYARHQNNLCAVSHFIVTNCVTGISMSVLRTRKPVGIESLKVFSTVTQLVSCRRRIQTQDCLSAKLMLLTISLA